jgi:hypothetical protein
MLDWDLLIALSAITVLAASAFCASRQISRSKNAIATKSFSLTIFESSLLFSLMFSWLFQAKLSWSEAIPLASVVL